MGREIITQTNNNRYQIITNLLLTLVIVLLGWLKLDITILNKHFTNHLSHHTLLEKDYEGRIREMEASRFTNKDGIDLERLLKEEIDSYHKRR